jgi:hypothetical protein
MNNSTATYIEFQDGTRQRSKYTEDIVNDVDMFNFVLGRTALTTTFNLGNATNASLVSFGTNFHSYVAVRVIARQVYTGVSFFTGTAGNWNCALYETGLQPPRRAITASAATTANAFNHQNFTTPYTAPTTRIMMIGLRTTSASQTALFLPANTYLNYGNNVMTNSTFNKRSQSYTDPADFPAVIPAGLTQLIQNFHVYIALY